MKDKLTPSERQTVNYYDHNAQEWSNKHGLVKPENWYQQETLELFRLIRNGKVLEIGPGYGKDAKKLIKHFGVSNYYGIEPSSGFITVAREYVSGANIDYTETIVLVRE